MDLTTAIIIATIAMAITWTIKSLLFWIICRQIESKKIGKNNCSLGEEVDSHSSDVVGKNENDSSSAEKTIDSKSCSVDDQTKEMTVTIPGQVECTDGCSKYVPDDEAEKTTDPDKNVEQKRKDLMQAVANGTAEELKHAIEWSIVGECDTWLKEDIHSAKIKLKELENFDRVKETLRSMPPSLISELRSYAKPPSVVYDVMCCVYMLLGEDNESKLKTWSSIQALMGRGGRNHLKRMIGRQQASDISLETIGKVNSILSKYDFMQIYLASEGAAAFYIWILEIMEEFQIYA